MEVFWPRRGLGGCRGVERRSRRPLSPTWAKSVNGLIYYKQYKLYFTAYRGTINLKWPGVFLFMYLFIGKEAVGTLGHYQLILLWGVFLWAEEIVCFDLLSKSEPHNTATGCRMRPRLCSRVLWSNLQNQAQVGVSLFLMNKKKKKDSYTWICHNHT